MTIVCEPPLETTPSLAPGDSLECTAKTVILQDDVNRGEVLTDKSNLVRGCGGLAASVQLLHQVNASLQPDTAKRATRVDMFFPSTAACLLRRSAFLSCSMLPYTTRNKGDRFYFQALVGSFTFVSGC